MTSLSPRNGPELVASFFEILPNEPAALATLTSGSSAGRAKGRQLPTCNRVHDESAVVGADDRGIICCRELANVRDLSREGQLCMRNWREPARIFPEAPVNSWPSREPR